MKQRLIALAAALSMLGLPALAQAPATPNTATVSGHVNDPTGAPIAKGTVGFYRDPDAKKADYSADVTNGDYKIEGIPAGTYAVMLRTPDTPPDKQVDMVNSFKITAGATLTLNFDLSRPDYIKQLSPEQQKQIAEIGAKNKTAMAENAKIANLNADLGAARTANATKDYAAAESVMLKDTAVRPELTLLWVELGKAQLGLKKYNDAANSLQKAITLNAADKKSSPEIAAVAGNALGESLAYAGKLDDAKAAYDAAAKVLPAKAATYYLNEAIVFKRLIKPVDEEEAASKSIAIDPSQPLAYYLRGEGLVAKAAPDATGTKIVLPPGCAEAYQKFLELDPDGKLTNPQFVADAKGILQAAGQTITSTYKAGKKK